MTAATIRTLSTTYDGHMAAGEYQSALEVLTRIQGLMSTMPDAERRNAKLSWNPERISDAIKNVRRLADRASLSAYSSPLMSQGIEYRNPTS